MNKKGMVLLYIISIFFIVSIFIFYGTIGNQTPGPQTLYLGENEIELFETYQEAEQQAYFIELAAILSAKQSSQESQSEFESDFERVFSGYLEGTEFEREDFSLTYAVSQGEMQVTGKASKDIILEKESHTYRISPNFNIEVPFEGESERVFV